MQVVEKANLPARSDSLVFTHESQSPDVSNCILQKSGARVQEQLALEISQDLCRR